MMGASGKEFYEYHRRRLAKLGHSIKRSDMAKALIVNFVQEAVNPEQAARKLWKRVALAQRG